MVTKSTNNIPIEIQRQQLGFSSPFPEEKLEIWENVSVPQANILKESGGYTPFSITRQAHFHPAPTIMVNGGIRGSKSVSTSMEAVAWAPHSDLMWLGGASYSDCRQEFEYLAEALLSLDWVSTRNISFPQNVYQPCSLETDFGTLIETKSLADAGDSLMSRAPDFLGMCEPGKTGIASYRRAKERVSTRRGRLWLGGTFELTAKWMEEFWQQWKRWPNEYNSKSFTSPTWINRVLYPGGRSDPAIHDLYLACEDFDEFLRRIVGVPAAAPEIIFSSSFKPREHVRNVEYSMKDSNDDYRPVYLAIDPGYGGESRYVVLAIQIVQKEIRIIDEISLRGKTHQLVKKEAGIREWWPVAKSGTIDPHAGGSHVFGSVSPQDEWRDSQTAGSVDLALPKKLHVEDLIRLIQRYLTVAGEYKLVISPKCERLLFEMRSWKRKKNQMGLASPADAPCDAIKALGYWLTHFQDGKIGGRPVGNRVLNYNLTGTGFRDPVLQTIAESEAQRLYGVFGGNLSEEEESRW